MGGGGGILNKERVTFTRIVAAWTTATPKCPKGCPRKCPRLDSQDHADAAKDNDEKRPKLTHVQCCRGLLLLQLLCLAWILRQRGVGERVEVHV